MRTLLLTDLHFTTTPRGLLDAQKKCVLDIIKQEKPQEVIILGDVFMKRRPSARVLLAVKEIVDYLKRKKVNLIILRGNHDSASKADDGITSLSLYNYHADVITEHTVDHMWKRVYIPHYENEENIIRYLREAPKGYTIFGHFGYFGCLNSVGDADFGLSLSEFHNRTFLGHIHNFNQRYSETSDSVTFLGTSYTTNFSEAGKSNYYAVLEDGPVCSGQSGETNEVSFKEATSGPKHIILDHDNLDDSELIEDNFFKIVRVYVSKLSDGGNHLIAKEYLDKYPIDCLEIKYKPVFDGDEENFYNPKEKLFCLSHKMLTDYVTNSATTIEKDYILSGLDIINNAYQED